MQSPARSREVGQRPGEPAWGGPGATPGTKADVADATLSYSVFERCWKLEVTDIFFPTSETGPAKANTSEDQLGPRSPVSGPTPYTSPVLRLTSGFLSASSHGQPHRGA